MFPGGNTIGQRFEEPEITHSRSNAKLPATVCPFTMSKSGVFLTFVLGLLAAAYVYWYTDWFRKPVIRITAQVRPGQPSQIPRNDGREVYPVSFGLDGKYQLTEVKVVAAAEAQTNAYPHVLWHLISESNSIPTKSVVYGQPMRGMRGKVDKSRPEPLEPDTVYRIFIVAGSYKGSADFRTREVQR